MSYASQKTAVRLYPIKFALDWIIVFWDGVDEMAMTPRVIHPRNKITRLNRFKYLPDVLVC